MPKESGLVSKMSRLQIHVPKSYQNAQTCLDISSLRVQSEKAHWEHSRGIPLPATHKRKCPLTPKLFDSPRVTWIGNNTRPVGKAMGVLDVSWS